MTCKPLAKIKLIVYYVRLAAMGVIMITKNLKILKISSIPISSIYTKLSVYNARISTIIPIWITKRIRQVYNLWWILIAKDVKFVKRVNLVFTRNK